MMTQKSKKLLTTMLSSALLAFSLSFSVSAQPTFDEQKLEQLTHLLQQSGSSSLMLLVDGKVAYSYGQVDKPHLIHSMRKPLVSALVGMASDRGQLDVQQTLKQLDLRDNTPLTDVESSATVGQLMQSRSGVYLPAAAVSKGMLKHMPSRSSHAPGTHYYYNNWDFNAVGEILQQATGKSIYELFDEQLAKPLGMQDWQNRTTSFNDETTTIDFKDYDGVMQFEPSKSKFGAYHFRLSTRDLAKFGQLYLQRGNWNGKQLLSTKWIDQTTQSYSMHNKRINIGYGMMWYVLNITETRPTKAFYHSGVGVHILAVYPGANMVMVHRVDTESDHRFEQQSLYAIIGAVFAARN